MSKKSNQSVAQQRRAARQVREKRERREKRSEPPRHNDPWLSRRTGLIVVAVISLIVAVFMTWNASTADDIGWGEALLWGLGFGVSIWVIFSLSLLFFGWIRGR
ncbi:MAG: hypothetical protein R3300_00290 [Candidatus Promineifilaceae bacterium]|nr:hypothetical protein [Candidatus Promineifilaceae bacterium]